MNLESTNRLFALSEKYRGIKAEIGTPMARNTGSGNLVEPVPKNNVPSLKKKTKPMTDEEEREFEKEVMPDAAKARERYRQRWIGKQTSMQVW